MKTTILSLFLILFLLNSCSHGLKTNSETSSDPLSWSGDAVMYEVNIRQYTPEGTFDAFAKHLPRLKDLGVEILWFMPIHPIGEKNRKGSLGSYYSIKDYKAVNPEFGTMSDFKELVAKAHEMGFKVLLDCVANHTSWDNVWMGKHKEWYSQDSLGNVIPPVPDWSDVADLNYNNPGLRAAMLDAMKFWVAEVGIDGYRCDYAGGVPTDFWETARAELDKIKPVFMLAEDQDHTDLLNKAFDCNYGWTFHHYMNEIYKGEKNAEVIPGYFAKIDSTYPEGTYPLQFTSNHDENSWQGTEYERLGNAVKTFAVLTFTVPGMPMIYSGQEAALNKRLVFFEKDTISWANLEMQDFYKTLISLKKENKALWNGMYGANIQFIKTPAPEKLLAFVRETDSNKILVIINLSNEEFSGSIGIEGKTMYKNLFEGGVIEIDSTDIFNLHPWGYRVFTGM